MRLFLKEAAYYAANPVSAVPYIASATLIYLGIVDPGEHQELSLVILVAGEVSLGLDGTLAKWSGGGQYKPDSPADMAVTAVPALFLTFASLFWFVQADYVPWQAMLVLAFLMLTAQVKYIDPRAGDNRPFIPLVLIGSLAYWVVATVVLADMAGLATWIAPLAIYVYGLFYARAHWERLLWFFQQARGELPKEV